MNRPEQLRKKIKEIEDRCAHWKSCQDGSYELSLYHAGYTEVCEELERLEKDDEM